MKAGFWEILLIVVLVLILFGHSKIPDLMRNLASGINVFKKELKTTNDKEKLPADKSVQAKKKAAVPIKKAKTVAAKPVKPAKSKGAVKTAKKATTAAAK